MRTIHMLGAGHMGGAILYGLRQQLKGTDSLRVIEVDAERSARYSSDGFQVSTRLETIEDDDIIVLAVPPQQFAQALMQNERLKRHRGPVISVMAGITLNTLTRELGHCNVVRSIPNTPSQVGEGVTLYYAPKSASPELTSAAQQVFGAIGVVIRVEDETQIDSGTALGGGGPALVAFFADALQEYAHDEGFDAQQAALIATQLLHGTARLIRETGKPAWQVCKDVQTKGGTTERAIDTFIDADLKGIVKAALQAAARRSVELGQ